MGRYITCEISGRSQNVWKYAFGDQPSEMYRIYEELGIGEYHPVRFKSSEDGTGWIYEYLSDYEGAERDILILNRSDLGKLKKCLDVLKQDSDQWLKLLQYDVSNNQKIWFAGMVEAIYEFMLKYPQQDVFTFEGEF
ncbi:MAG: hypothetical protein AAFX95_22985 [Cyanobacteria bacterium J06639_16]